MERTARAVAQYFLNHDTSGQLRDKALVTRNNRNFYSGNARLNKYLRILRKISTLPRLVPNCLRTAYMLMIMALLFRMCVRITLS